MNEQLDVDYWIDKTIWEEYQIPYLFLGYEPPSSYISRPLDDVITLDGQEDDRYIRYKSLIKDAIYSGELTPVASNLMGFSSLRAVDIKVWRKTKHSIEPVEIYVEMEKKIQEPDAADNSVKSKTITNREPKPYNPRHEIYKKVMRKKSVLDSTIGWQRAVEIVGLRRKGGYVVDDEGNKVTEKSFQNNYSESIRPLLSNSKES